MAKSKDANNQVLEQCSTAYMEVQYGAHYSIEDRIEFSVNQVTQSYLDFRWETAAYTGDLRLLHELEVPSVTFNHGILTRDFIGIGIPNANAAITPDIRTLLGCINKTNTREYVSTQLGKTFKIGTLLMMEPDIRDSLDMQNIAPVNNFGAKGFAVTVKFLYKEGGHDQGDDEDTHNLFWRPIRKDSTGIFLGGWDRLEWLEPGATGPSAHKYRPIKPNLDIDDNWLIPANPPLPVLV